MTVFGNNRSYLRVSITVFGILLCVLQCLILRVPFPRLGWSPTWGQQHLGHMRLSQVMSTYFSCGSWCSSNGDASMQSFKAPKQTWIPFLIVFKTPLTSSTYKRAANHFLNRNKIIYANSIHPIYPLTGSNIQKYKTPFNLCNSVLG